MAATGARLLQSRVRLDPPGERENLASLLRNGMQKHSSRILLVDAQRNCRWTGDFMLDKAERIATGLIQLAGLESGQVVLTICDHSGYEILLTLGIVLAGGAIFGTSPEDGLGEELNYCRMVKPSVIVCNSNLHQMVVKLKQQLAGLEETRIVWIDNPLDAGDLVTNVSSSNSNSNNINNNIDEEYYRELMKRDQVILFGDLLGGRRDSSLIGELIATKIADRSQNVTFLLTSGSTGRPKVVASTHEELVWSLQTLLCAIKYPIGSASAQMDHKILLPLDETSVLAGDLPLDHGAGLTMMLLSVLVGSRLIILPAYKEDSFWQGVNDHRISISVASTTFTYKLLARLKQLINSGAHKQWDLSSLKFLACCGSKLAFQDLVREINSVYPDLVVGQAYGCTEMAFISILAPQDCREHLSSVGNLVPGMTGKVICLDSGKLLGPNERGHLYLSSMTKFKGYKCLPGDDPDLLFRQCHDDQGLFYKTGDLVHYDQEERLYIHGRIKDTLYLMQDWKILPIELEDIVNEHPLVEYSAVVGVPDPDLPGCDAPRAFVKLIGLNSKEFQELKLDSLRDKLVSQDREFIVKDIYDFVAERTAEPKHLKGGVRILEDFPRNGHLAKVDRKALKQMS